MNAKIHVGLLKSLLYITEMIIDQDANPDLSYSGKILMN